MDLLCRFIFTTMHTIEDERDRLSPNKNKKKMEIKQFKSVDRETAAILQRHNHLNST